MTKYAIYLCLLSLALLASSCNKKKVTQLEDQLATKTEQVKQLEDQLAFQQKTNNSLLDRMSDLSIVSKTGAESIKKSLENMSNQYDYIENLSSKIQQKDSINLALVMNLKRSLGNTSTDDIQVEVRGGKVHVSISDKLLFPSGSARLNDESQRVLANLATVLNDHDQIDIMVEGHTDNVPITGSCITDNWDLSVRRATSVVRTLQQDYYVSPNRLTAAGRAEYAPRADNNSSSGRSSNRRTEIVITPKLDQFFQLLEAPPLAN